MSEKVYIHDDFGNPIPLLDNHGNLSMQVIMLYAEDRLTEADRQTVDRMAAADEMTRDALDGFALTASTAKARTRLAEVNAHIQKTTGAAAVASTVSEKPKFDYRKMAAAIAALVIIGAGSFFLAEYLSKPQLADGTTPTEETEPPRQEPQQTVTEREPELMDEALSGLAVEEPEPTADATVNMPPVADALSKNTTEKTTPSATGREEVKPKQIEQQLETNTLRSNTTSRSDVAKAEPTEAALADAETQPSTPSAAKKKDLSDNKTAESARKPADMEETAALQQEVVTLAAESTAAGAAMPAAAQETENREQAKDRTRAAKYPGGDMAMYKFIERKKVYTEAMQAQGMTGAVSVTFDIEPDGRVTNAKVKSGTFGPLNEDALRVVRTMPNWQPAQGPSGENVRSSRTVVVKYGDP